MVKKHQYNKSKGVALIEWVITLPVLLLLGLGCLQWALIWEARAALNYAALLAARAGAVSSLDIGKMQEAFDKGLYVFDRAVPARRLIGVRNYQIRILNPTVEAFKDFGGESTQKQSCASGEIKASECEIPDDRLERRSPVLGRLSGVNIQDANLLKIEVVYAFELKIPFIGPALGRWVRSGLPLGSEEYRLAIGHGMGLLRPYFAIPITTTATVRMQTPARFNSRVLTRAEVDARAGGKLL